MLQAGQVSGGIDLIGGKPQGKGKAIPLTGGEGP
jgi:hypothetical protein